jgi:hypothetical protein
MENRLGFEFTNDRGEVGARYIGAQMTADPIALGLAGKADPNQIMPRERAYPAKTAADKATAAGDEDFQIEFFQLRGRIDCHGINFGNNEHLSRNAAQAHWAGEHIDNGKGVNKLPPFRCFLRSNVNTD